MTIRYRHSITATDRKTIPYNSVAPQYRRLICVLQIKPTSEQHEELTGPPQTKWYRFNIRNDLPQKATDHYERRTNEAQTKNTIHKVAYAAFRMTMSK